jgi:hypothetical protein
VFRFDPANGSLVWLHTFESGAVADTASVLVSTDGFVYGAIDTSVAKTERVFRLAPEGGGVTILRTLTSAGTSGSGTSALAEGPGGALYGVTTRNGSSTVPLLFRLTKDGSAFTPLQNVSAGANPATVPPLGILAASNGLLYGVASNALFSAAADGSSFQTLHTFPNAVGSFGPITGFDGKLYGAFTFGGPVSRGAVYRIATDGSGYEEVATFPNDPLSGQAPLNMLVTAADGAFCGFAQFGGDANRGTFFRVATPEQIVGIDKESLGFDVVGRFRGSVVGPPGRPVDVWHSDDLETWTFLQRVKAPETHAMFIDPAFPLPARRFYRATAPR